VGEVCSLVQHGVGVAAQDCSGSDELVSIVETIVSSLICVECSMAGRINLRGMTSGQRWSTNDFAMQCKREGRLFLLVRAARDFERCIVTWIIRRTRIYRESQCCAKAGHTGPRHGAGDFVVAPQAPVLFSRLLCQLWPLAATDKSLPKRLRLSRLTAKRLDYLV